MSDNHKMPNPADQRWFWTERWQQREREVDAHVAADEVLVHRDGNALLEYLDQLDATTGTI
ncbi:hypothetical protein B1790_06405 [Mycobacterium sp. AT1]|nr:hypothetical protein B1790_06405 [Mycobacterium sp. AT1]